MQWGGAPNDCTLNRIHENLKMQLLGYTRRIYPGPKYRVQKFADKFETAAFSIKILFLPVPHPKLNHIEMVWSSVKRAIASRNMIFK